MRKIRLTEEGRTISVDELDKGLMRVLVRCLREEPEGLTIHDLSNRIRHTAEEYRNIRLTYMITVISDMSKKKVVVYGP